MLYHVQCLPMIIIITSWNFGKDFLKIKAFIAKTNFWRKKIGSVRPVIYERVHISHFWPRKFFSNITKSVKSTKIHGFSGFLKKNVAWHWAHFSTRREQDSKNLMTSIALANFLSFQKITRKLWLLHASMGSLWKSLFCKGAFSFTMF